MSESGCESVLCVDIGGTSAKVALLDRSGELHFTDSIPTRAPVESFVQQLCELIKRTLEQARGRGHDPAGLGVAVAGFLDPERESMVYNSNLGWLEKFPLRTRLRERFDMPVELEVDSNAACVAEYRFGSGRGCGRFLCLTAGTGLGVGMTIDGVPLRFAYGCLGDIGHIIVQPNGPRCTCRGRGCAEALISAPVLAERYRAEMGLETASLRDVITAAIEGHDEAAMQVLEEAGEWLGIATASMANIFFPDHVAIAGGLSAAGSFLMEAVERTFRNSASILARETASLSLATLGSRATLIGAAWPFWEARQAGI